MTDATRAARERLAGQSAAGGFAVVSEGFGRRRDRARECRHCQQRPDRVGGGREGRPGRRRSGRGHGAEVLRRRRSGELSRVGALIVSSRRSSSDGTECCQVGGPGVSPGPFGGPGAEACEAGPGCGELVLESGSGEASVAALPQAGGVDGAGEGTLDAVVCAGVALSASRADGWRIVARGLAAGHGRCQAARDRSVFPREQGVRWAQFPGEVRCRSRAFAPDRVLSRAALRSPFGFSPFSAGGAGILKRRWRPLRRTSWSRPSRAIVWRKPRTCPVEGCENAVATSLARHSRGGSCLISCRICPALSSTGSFGGGAAGGVSFRAARKRGGGPARWRAVATGP